MQGLAVGACSRSIAEIGVHNASRADLCLSLPDNIGRRSLRCRMGAAAAGLDLRMNFRFSCCAFRAAFSARSRSRLSQRSSPEQLLVAEVTTRLLQPSGLKTHMGS